MQAQALVRAVLEQVAQEQEQALTPGRVQEPVVLEPVVLEPVVLEPEQAQEPVLVQEPVVQEPVVQELEQALELVRVRAQALVRALWVQIQFLLPLKQN